MRLTRMTLPKVVDPRLKIELFAAEPDIVTPTGLAVDARGRVLVVESHTHFRPEGYVGPPADRIRMFEDTDGDGRADRITTFFEGTTWTMNIGVHPDGFGLRRHARRDLSPARHRRRRPRGRAHADRAPGDQGQTIRTTACRASRLTSTATSISASARTRGSRSS